MEPAFRTSGVASGIDAVGIVDKLMAIESRPLTLITQKKSTLSVKISGLGSLANKLDNLKGVAVGLKASGISVISPASTYDDFSVSGSASAEGRYTVKVETLARSGKLRTNTELLSNVAPATTGDELHLKIDGAQFAVTGLTGKNISEVASAINTQMSNVTASVIATGTGYHLSIARKDTGFVLGQPASSAIEVDSGFANADAGLGLVTPVGQEAKNAKVWVDGVAIERRTNEIANVIPGVTLALKAASNTDKDVVFSRNSSASATNLQRFVDSFNEVAKFLREQLRPEPGSKSDDDIGGATVVGIQGRLQGFLSSIVNTTGSIRSLGNLGVSLKNDGTLSLDSTKLDAAIAKDPAAVNAIFQKAVTGLGTTVETFVKLQTNSIDGSLVVSQKGLQAQSKRLDSKTESLKRHLDARREQLLKQFTAMEKAMGTFSAIGNYLQSQKLPGFSHGDG